MQEMASDSKAEEALDVDMSDSKQNTATKLSDPVAFSSGSSMSEDDLPPPYAGMGKEMVMKYSNTPGWIRCRKFLLIFFWLSWCVLLGAVIYLTVTHPKCTLAPTKDWWKKTAVYQVYPLSFKDSDGDGKGDLNGIKEKLDYLQSIGIETIWLSPFYKSPMKDFGYDVTDFKDVHPDFGTLTEFDDLLKSVHDKGMKLLIDFIPNHTSDEHPWFNKSVARIKPYDNYYIWEDCGNGTAFPNNWIATVGGSAWQYNAIRDQCYFHQYQKAQPDLNIRNNQVRDELDSILRFWLDREVDGIRVDAIIRLCEDYDLRNESRSYISNDSNSYDYLIHNATRNLPEIMDHVNRWRGVLDEYSTPNYKMLITEANAMPSELRMYYGSAESGGADFPFNFQLTKADSNCAGVCISKLVADWQDAMSGILKATSNWVLGNHDVSRVGSRVGKDKVDALNMLVLLLPGVSTTYYGEEIGMEDLPVELRPPPLDQAANLFPQLSRDPQRTPMQWSADVDICHGFTKNKTCSITWLPIHPNATVDNVENQQTNPLSHLSLYKNLTKLRKEDTFVHGNFNQHVISEDVYSFIRFYDGMPSYLVAVNLGKKESIVNLANGLSDQTGTVSVVTGAVREYEVGESVDLAKVTLQPGDGIVFTWPFKIQEYI